MAVPRETEFVCLLVSLPDLLFVAGIYTYRQHHPFLCAIRFSGDCVIGSCYEFTPTD